MVCFVNFQSVDRIIYSIFQLPAFQPGMENPHPPRIYTSGLTVTLPATSFDLDREGW